MKSTAAAAAKSSNRSYTFLRRDPDKAYRDTQLWIPKKYVNQLTVKKSLEVSLARDNEKLILWDETDSHIITPREYLSDVSERDLPFRIVDRQPDFKRVKFTDLMVLRDSSQRMAWQAFSQAKCGVLNLACGKGKTALGCKKIAQSGKPALVVVNQGSLMDQWEQEIEKFLGKVDVGRVQQSTFDWEKPIVIAMIHTLALRAADWPLEFRKYYGTIIFDEIHHLSAPLFSQTAPLFYGERYGLTATPEREDGTEIVYYMHVGNVFYSDMEQELDPTIYFQRLDTYVDMNSDEVRDKLGEFNISRYRAHLGQLEKRNKDIAGHILSAHAKGRRILALGHGKAGLYMLESLIPGAKIITGDTPQSERLKVFQESPIVLSTMEIATEAMNAPALDTVFFTTPFKSWRNLLQGMGRALRAHEGKKNPVIVVFEDFLVGPSKGLCRRLKTDLVKNGFSPITVDPQGE